MAMLRQNLTALITRNYPFLSGCGTLANCKLVKVLSGSGGGQAWARLPSGSEILVPLNDYVGRSAFFVGDLDRKITEVIRRIVRPGDHVLDIGANLGLVTLQMARLVGGGGRVDSFEPNPAMHSLLSQSLERNKYKHVRLHTCALGSQDGDTLTLNFPESNAGQGTLTSTRPQEGWTSVKVPVRTLAALASEFQFDPVRLLKIDVEGFESEVFKGALPWLRSSPPGAIVFESNEGSGQGQKDPVVALLADLGYSFYSIPKRLVSLRLVPYKHAEGIESTSHDMLAVAKDQEREILSHFQVKR